MKDFTTKESKKVRIHPVFILTFWVLVWQILALMMDQELLLPTVPRTIKALIGLSNKGFFWSAVFTSMLRVIMGFMTSLFLGLILGFFSGLNRTLHSFLHPVVIAIQSTPVMSVIIVALLWFKSSHVPVFVSFLMCFPIVWINVSEGVHHVDQNLLQMAKIYEIPFRSLLINIYLPSIKPYVLAAMKNTLGLSWKVTVAAEVLSSPRVSIGHYLLNSKIYLESDQLFAWTVVIILLSFFFERALKWLVKKGGTR